MLLCLRHEGHEHLPDREDAYDLGSFSGSSNERSTILADGSFLESGSGKTKKAGESSGLHQYLNRFREPTPVVTTFNTGPWILLCE